MFQQLLIKQLSV